MLTLFQVQIPAPVVALLGLSRLDYMITMFGLTRLGYAVLILSPRLPVESSVHLLRTADANIIVYDHALEHVVQSIRQEADILSIPMLSRTDYDVPNDRSDRFRLEIDETLASDRTSFIMHSSGSTGLPKLIYQTHQSSLETFAFGWGVRAFTTAPIFHTYGHSTLFRSIYTSGTIYMYNANVPLTSRGLTAALEEVKPEVFFAVPYVLKLVAESQRGLAALRACATVSTSGSACPDDLGSLLTESGVHYVTALGL
jgi:acyl-coenzyme A synthetase/AMP-(fatty) acid ligase